LLQASKYQQLWLATCHAGSGSTAPQNFAGQIEAERDISPLIPHARVSSRAGTTDAFKADVPTLVIKEKSLGEESLKI
jgi:hypothetical protein